MAFLFKLAGWPSRDTIARGSQWFPKDLVALSLARECENLHTFAQFVNGSLQARQRKLRRLQAQCPATIFSEAEWFRTEPTNSDLPVQPDVHFFPMIFRRRLPAVRRAEANTARTRVWVIAY